MEVCEGVSLLPLSEFSDFSELFEEAERSVDKQRELKPKVCLNQKGVVTKLYCQERILTNEKWESYQFQKQNINKATPPGWSHLIRLLS